jgi:predicted small secreted protein
MMKKLAALAAIAGIVIGVSACNTVEGAGKDVKAAGTGIEKAADKAKPY